MDATLVSAIVILATATYFAGDLVIDRLRLRRRRIIVVLKDAPRSSWRGVLWHQTRHHLELRDAAYLEADTSVPVDGVLVLPRSNIAWIQNTEEH